VLKVGRLGFGCPAESGQKTLKLLFTAKGVGRKISGGGEATKKKTENQQKIAHLNLYLLNLYHV